MEDHWLEIPDDDIDATSIEEKIRRRLAQRDGTAAADHTEDPEVIAHTLWKDMIENSAGDEVTIQPRDCDILPHNYVIGWRVPILGPVHALVRRLINAEIRRYISSSLEKQSYLNRQVVRLLQDLVDENKRLRREIEELRKSQG